MDGEQAPLIQPEPADLAPLEAWLQTYTSGQLELAGYLFEPAPNGRRPALVINHGSNGLIPDRVRHLAQALNGRGYAAFFPVRRGYHHNPGPSWHSLVSGSPDDPGWGSRLVPVLRDEGDDVLSAHDWLARQAGVDSGRMAVMGSSFGGIMTTLVAARESRFKAAVNFAGAAMNWHRPAMREMMLDAVRGTKLPFFLIQAQNDYSIGPTYDLGAELARLGKPHEARIYGPHGTTPAEGHSFFMTAVSRWFDDVDSFLAHWLVPRLTST